MSLLLAKLKKLDYVMLAILLLMLGFSTLVIYSATIDNAKFGPQKLYYDNVRNYMIGFVVMIMAALFDYRYLRKWPFIYMLWHYPVSCGFFLR